MPVDADVSPTADNPRGHCNRTNDPDSDDEMRLLPTSIKDRNYQHSVGIVPGKTFKNSSKPSPKTFAVHKPIDTISQNARESGPVRSSNINKIKHIQSFVTSTPTLSPHFPRFHDGERPPKRRRRDSSGKHSDNTAHSVINLAEEDDDPFSHPHSLVIDATLVPGDLSPSPPMSHRSGSHHKPKNSPIRVHEFRAVEKIIKCPNNQRRNILGKTDMDLIEIPDDPPTAESVSMENSKTHGNANQCCTKNLAFESIESGDPSEPHKLSMSEEPCNLRTRFVSTDGRQRTADIRESPDELQGDVTVGPAPSAPANALQNTWFPKYKSPDAKNRRSFSSDIRPTRFANHKRLSPTATRKIRSKTGHKTSYRILYIHYESFKRSAADGECMYLLFDQDRESFVISMNEESPQVPVIFGLHRIAMVRHGPENCPKVQLKFRKAEGNFDITADLEFSSSEEMTSFLKHLELNSIRTLRKESEWMNKVFELERKDPNSAANTGKRSSSDASEVPVPEEKTEHSKRQKLSASMQDDNGVIRPAERIPSLLGQLRRPVRRLARSSMASVVQNEHSHREALDGLNGELSIPIKKYIPERLERRETRSQSRRDLVTLIPEDGDTHQESDFDEDLPKWSKPLLYPPEGKRRAEVNAQDLERLRDGEFLNDNLIGLYIRFLEHHLERKKPKIARQIYFFNTYFFATLTNTTKGKKINYEGVEKWTRNVDIFSHDYIVVPINESAHWYVAIICNMPSLRRALQDSQNLEEFRVQESEVSHAQCSEEKVPETPQASQEVNFSSREGQQEFQNSAEVETTGEEDTRQSFASMTLSDRETGAIHEKGSHKSEEWPGEDEKPSTPPQVFCSIDDTTHSTGKKIVFKADGPKSNKPLSRLEKSKRKSGSFFRRVNHDQPVIITFDSLDLPRNSTIKVLREYLEHEASSKTRLTIDKTKILGMRAREIPKQPNYSDCGLYLLAYVEKFVQDPNEFTRRLVSKEMSATEDWPPVQPGLLRRRLRDFLYKLEEEQSNIQRKIFDGKVLMADGERISYLLGSEEPVEDQDQENHASDKRDEEVLENREPITEVAVRSIESKRSSQREEVIIPDSQPGDPLAIDNPKESVKDAQELAKEAADMDTLSPKSGRMESINLASRKSPRQTRQNKYRQDEQFSTVSVVISDEPRHRTPERGAINGGQDMQNTSPTTSFEIVVPETPPPKHAETKETLRTSPRLSRYGKK